MMRKVLVVVLTVWAIFIGYKDVSTVYALKNIDHIYTIYDTEGEFLFQQEGVEVGDMYMGKDFIKYEVVSINESNFTGVATIYENMKKPNVSINDNIYGSEINKENKNICLYMTHNDESYLPSDGYDSIYGNGGILDVAKAFKNNLENLGINAHLDDTLHIPHDNYAYSRSKKTASNMYDKYAPDAIFDIHRDATSRSLYLAQVDGRYMGKVRIVLGRANPYLAENEEFAIYLLSIASEMYPWLFLDIYYGKGDYNQAISSKALLFEMGCHLIEKEYEIASTKNLADVINVALYGTTINEDTGDLTINGIESSNETKVNDVLDIYDDIRKESSVVEDAPSNSNIENMIYLGLIIILLSGISIVSIVCIAKDYINIANKK